MLIADRLSPRASHVRHPPTGIICYPPFSRKLTSRLGEIDARKTYRKRLRASNFHALGIRGRLDADDQFGFPPRTNYVSFRTLLCQKKVPTGRDLRGACGESSGG
jgi:hypothetical protein